MSRRRYRKAFTMLEALFAIFLIAIAVTALIGSNISFTQANAFAVEYSTAEFLAEQVRELTDLLPVIDPETEMGTFGSEEASLVDYDDVDDFDGASFSPPISSARESLAEFSAYTQQVVVENVTSSNLEQVTWDHGSSFVRVTVEVLFNGNEISSASWIRAEY